MAAPSFAKTHLSLLSLFAFLILVQAKPSTLYHSDYEALLIVQRDLKKVQDINNTNPCNSRGVFCERRVLNNSYVLRVSRVIFDSHQLNGFLSPAIGKLSELKELSLSNNQLIDRIPTGVVKCRKLEILNLRDNQFSGKVPPDISSLSHLRVLDLSSNKLSGEVPFSIRSFWKLQFLDISGNSFVQDRFPNHYIFAEKNNSTRNENSTKSAIAALAPAPAPSSSRQHKHNKKRGLMILGFAVGAVAGIFSGLIFCLVAYILLILIRGGEKDSGPMIFSPLIKKVEDLSFLEKEDALATLEAIGEGGCGKVYKATLPGFEGKTIAIKKVIQPLGDDPNKINEEDSKLLNKKIRQVKAEIRTVGQIRHRNLLPLLAHVPTPDCHYLVYEFMKNGSLQGLLTEVSQGNRELNWLARHKIALGVAAGLEYLHLNHNPRILHRDLKPGNILIDDDMEARISDFGLAKVMPDIKTHVTVSQVAGTFGFMAPEYMTTLKFTEKCDIHSFGVVLGILVIGKLPNDAFFQDTSEINLVKWMRNVMSSEDPKRAIDPKLMGNGYEEQMLLVLKIACFCTLDDPKQRPTSKDVRCMLSQIEHNDRDIEQL